MSLIYPNSFTIPSCRWKTTCIMNGAIAPYFHSQLVQHMQIHPYSVLVDGSNDTGLEKLNPLTVRIFDIRSRKVMSHFLDMCTTTGTGAATAATIYDKISEVLVKNSIPWINCVAFGVDNTNVNIGVRNSIMSRVLLQNKDTYFMGCPCHLIHNIARRAADKFLERSGFDVEDMCVDLYYYFDKSTKRKSNLKTFCLFCDVEYHKVVKHVNTRWLSLERAVERILSLFDGLKSYFLSNSESEPRFKRLKTLFNNPILEVYLLFYNAVLPMFTIINKYLQREDPCIFAAYQCLHEFVKKVLGKILPPEKVKEVEGFGFKDLKVDIREDQLDDEEIFIGIATRQKLTTLFHEGSISPKDYAEFLTAVRQFYQEVISEATKKLPLNDNLLKHARFVDFFEKSSVQFSDVEFFLLRYRNILSHIHPVTEIEQLYDEFVDYKILKQDSIPEDVWESAKVQDEEQVSRYIYRMDVIWAYLSQMKLANGELRYKRLSEVAKLVLIIPHSNAGEERVFSMIRKNKTAFRPSMNVDGTLSSVLTMKMAIPEPCHTFEPPKEVVANAKKATYQYNKTHSNKE